MEQVLDKVMIENAEKQRHNSMISERYRQLFDAVEDQLSTPVVEENAYVSTVVEAPVVESTPIVEQAPTVTEYTPSTLASSVFTAEKFERMENAIERDTFVAPAQPATVTKAETATETRYSLTPLAKVVMAVFTLVVITMLAFIGVNSQTIQRKSVRLKNLEEKKQELVEKNEEIQRHIQELQTEESIIERATEAGLIG